MPLPNQRTIVVDASLCKVFSSTKNSAEVGLSLFLLSSYSVSIQCYDWIDHGDAGLISFSGTDSFVGVLGRLSWQNSPLVVIPDSSFDKSGATSGLVSMTLPLVGAPLISDMGTEVSQGYTLQIWRTPAGGEQSMVLSMSVIVKNVAVDPTV